MELCWIFKESKYSLHTCHIGSSSASLYWSCSSESSIASASSFVAPVKLLSGIPIKVRKNSHFIKENSQYSKILEQDTVYFRSQQSCAWCCNHLLHFVEHSQLQRWIANRDFRNINEKFETSTRSKTLEDIENQTLVVSSIRRLVSPS